MLKRQKQVLTAALAAVLTIITILLIVFVNSRVNKTYRLVFVTKTVNPNIYFWQTVRAGMETACKEYGVELTVYGPQNESGVDEQNELIRKAINEKPDAILLAAAHYSSQNDICDEIVKAGIKLITVDSDIGSDVKTSFIGTNNYEAGRLAGMAISNLVSDKGKIAIISFVAGSSTANDREEGFISSLSEEQKKNVIGPYYCDTSVEEAKRLTLEVIKSTPDLEGMVGLNEPSASGMILGVKEEGLSGKLKLVGIDSSLIEIKGLEDGTAEAIVVQKPFNMGYLGVTTALDVLSGKSVERFIDTGTESITRENMYTKENQKLLFIFADIPDNDE